MKISELIEQLQSVQQAHWDIQVVVQYRDEWWEYNWYDTYIWNIIKDWNIIL